MARYKIKWRSFDTAAVTKICKEVIFDDVSWKDYGVRATVDEPYQTMIIPYTSIYEVELVD